MTGSLLQLSTIGKEDCYAPELALAGLSKVVVTESFIMPSSSAYCNFKNIEWGSFALFLPVG